MRRLGHHVTGLAAGVLAGVGAQHFGGTFALVAVAGYAGGTAPDWLEMPRTNRLTGGRWSLIPHRTITHWLLFWLIAFGWSLTLVGNVAGDLALGFTTGALMHLAMDVPNPMGIWGLWPGHKVSLNWWRSGQHDLVLSIASLGIAWLAYTLLMPVA